MASMDETVVREEVLELIEKVKAEGWKTAFERLEQEEPVLAGFACFAFYMLMKKLDSLRLPRRAELVIEAELMTAQIVCIEAMRQASRHLWSDFLPDMEGK